MKDVIDYKSKDGIIFQIRGEATRGDQMQMKVASGESSKLAEDGKSVHVNAMALYPWLVKRFVTGWSQKEAWSYEALEAMPADPTEDLIFVLGSFILNHVKGLTQTAEAESKKKS